MAGGFLKRVRDQVGALATGGLQAAGAALPGVPRLEGLHVGRVLGGPLRGKLLAMPTRQRPSYLLGTFEPHVVQAMQAHVSPGSVAYDIGANVGYHTLVLADLVGKDGCVVAVEPSPVDRPALEATLQLKGLGDDRVRVVAAALAEQPGSVQFATFGYSGIGRIASEREPADAMIQTVQATTLDRLVLDEGYPPPDFLKLDVEGAELRALLGSMQVLKAYRPVIVCEVRWATTDGPIRTLLGALGYEAAVLHRGEKIGDLLLTPTR